MELVQVKQDNSIKPINQSSLKNPGNLPELTKEVTIKKQYSTNPFIEANTKEVSLSCLRNDCLVPVFAKDNERTIAHQEFIDVTHKCISSVFQNQQIDDPEIRASHIIKGRIPTAINKPAKELLDFEVTKYFERMAFVIRVPSITENINGNDLSLMVGGVRAYNQENLYSKKSIEKFKVFIGFQNRVCSNLCISSDGFVSEMRVGSYQELESKILDLIQNYQMDKHLQSMKDLSNLYLTEHQFAQIIGKAKLYNYLPKLDKANIPRLEFNDGQMNTIVKHYYEDESFSRDTDRSVSLWNVFNLFTAASKSSYIDSFLDRNENALNFTNSIAKTLKGENKYHWFLS